ncbi:hypothetical protein LR48_Vigan06g021800 [Vigna angularis]|uniref:Uncharacterized protein n=1 Tax=Phaseolus angularis TaxID=3914 RepID=A0A0L9UQN9_PHAAN|nr:hypothetical protein LR48_Vigan06g021800 [Vigna angularis]
MPMDLMGSSTVPFFLNLFKIKKSDRHQTVAATETVATVDLLSYKTGIPSASERHFPDLALSLSFSFSLFSLFSLFLERLDFCEEPLPPCAFGGVRLLRPASASPSASR